MMIALQGLACGTQGMIYSHRLKASCATNGYLLDFYWKLGRDIEAKQYTNTYGSGFYKNLSQDLKNEMPGVKGFSPTT